MPCGLARHTQRRGVPPFSVEQRRHAHQRRPARPRIAQLVGRAHRLNAARNKARRPATQVQERR
ncbi:hypothetical protein SE17_17735 [Kouleothrix aurantiaca]|uniref:Uncharacterized protein n=1 Tax=Kouleothrix aurantiaca TaxID=186479 RepID=A0A0P9DPK7_9CHLR|nr:hypothetical protein SE17_17735 [Kouleothrix aurantiaca]